VKLINNVIKLVKANENILQSDINQFNSYIENQPTDELIVTEDIICAQMLCDYFIMQK
jgi:hypothetical protein